MERKSIDAPAVEVLRAALVIVMVAGLGVGSAAGKGKPPPKEPEPVTRYEVRYEIAPSPLLPLATVRPRRNLFELTPRTFPVASQP